MKSAQYYYLIVAEVTNSLWFWGGWYIMAAWSPGYYRCLCCHDRYMSNTMDNCGGIYQNSKC